MAKPLGGGVSLGRTPQGKTGNLGRENETIGRDNDVKGRESDVRGREDDVRGREDDVRGREDDVRGREDDVRGRENDLRQRGVFGNGSSREAGIVVRATVEAFGPVGDTELVVNVKWPAGSIGYVPATPGAAANKANMAADGPSPGGGVEAKIARPLPDA
jgi:hypothetical protein